MLVSPWVQSGWVKRWDMEAGSLGLKILRHTRLSRVAALLHPSAHPVPPTLERPWEAGLRLALGLMPVPQGAGSCCGGAGLRSALWDHSSSKNQGSLLIELLPPPSLEGAGKEMAQLDNRQVPSCSQDSLSSPGGPFATP